MIISVQNKRNKTLALVDLHIYNYHFYLVLFVSYLVLNAYLKYTFFTQI